MDWTFLKDIFGKAEDAVESVAPYAIPGGVAAVDAWNALKSQAKTWARKVVVLYNTPVAPQLESQKNDLLSRAKIIKNKVESIMGALDELRDTNLGIAVPVIVGASVIAVVAAAITKWSLDYNALMSLNSQVDKMVASGMSYQDAYNLATKAATTAKSNSTFGKIADIAPWALGAFLLYTFRDKFK